MRRSIALLLVLGLSAGVQVSHVDEAQAGKRSRKAKKQARKDKRAKKKAARKSKREDKKEARQDKREARRQEKEDKNKGSCTSAAQVTSDVYEYAGPILHQVLDKAGPQAATASQIIKAVDKGVKAWNKLAGNSWARIGPRRLDFNKTHKGNVVGTTERVFVAPMVAFRPVTVEIKKVDGKGRTKVVVCKVPKRGAPKQMKVFYMDPGDRAGKTWRVKMPRAAGEVVKVVFHGKKFGTISTRYTVRANQAMR